MKSVLFYYIIHMQVPEFENAREHAMSSLPSRGPRWFSALRQYLIALLNRYQPPAQAVALLTALAVGIWAGFGAVVFRWLIATVRHIAFYEFGRWLHFLGHYYVVLVPALGGLIVGPMTYFWAREAKGHGVPEVMEAMALRGGRIRPVVAVVKALASSVNIGTGGSVGREGPIVQIGSGFGSTLGQVLGLSDDRIRTLVACGAAGGIAATFNTPIAGVFFALEIIIGEFSVRHFSSVVIAAVAASVIGRIFLGNMPAFPVPPYALVHVAEFGLYLILGILAALAAVLFVRLLYSTEDFFERWPLPEYVKPAIGGLIVGGIGLFYPQVFGVGYETIEQVLLSYFSFKLALILLFAKILATSMTLGSGGSGGIFAPSLFIGAMLGGAFGTVVHALWPEVTAAPGAYALVGMAAVFSGAAHAPITAVTILFEMTGDYRIILPLMLATAMSTVLTYYFLHGESIYTLKLARRGVHLERGHDIDVMQGVLVQEVMTRDVDTVPADMPLSVLVQEFQRTGHHGFPVLDEQGYLFGIVTLQDLRNALERKDAEHLTAGDIATKDVLTVFPDDPMWVALKRMGIRDVGRIPVVAHDNPQRLVGLVRRSDIIRAYQLGILRKAELQRERERLQLGRLDHTKFVNLTLPPGSPVVGKRIADVSWPPDCVVVAIERGREVIIPHGQTVLYRLGTVLQCL